MAYRVRDYRRILDASGVPISTRPKATASGYQSAGTSLHRSSVPGIATDSWRDLTPTTRQELMRKARWAKKNSGLIRSMAAKLTEYAIGSGIIPIPDTGDLAINEQYFDYFNEWAKSPLLCDTAGRLTFWDSQRARALAKFYDGDILTVLRQTSTGEPTTQFIRAHAIKHNTAWLAQNAVKPTIIDGVQVNQAYRTLGYYITQKDGTGAFIAARSGILSAMIEDTDQVRGVTALAHALNGLVDVEDLLDLETQALKQIGAWAVAHTTASGEVEEIGGEEFFDSDDAQRVPVSDSRAQVEKVYGARSITLAPNEKIEAIASNRPSSTFTGFLDSLGRRISLGCYGFPYEIAWLPTGVYSASMRAVLDQVKAAVRPWRASEIKDSQRIYSYVIAKGIDNGDIPMANDWWVCDWLPTAPDPTIDRRNDGKEIRESIAAGTLSMRDAMALQGRYWRWHIDQVAEEQAYVAQVLGPNYRVGSPQTSPAATADMNLTATLEQ